MRGIGRVHILVGRCLPVRSLREHDRYGQCSSWRHAARAGLTRTQAVIEFFYQEFAHPVDGGIKNTELVTAAYALAHNIIVRHAAET